MLRWALAFLMLTVIAALFGFGGIAVASADASKTLFFMFLIVFVITGVVGLAAGRRMT